MTPDPRRLDGPWSTELLSRRRALARLGVVGIGAVVAACGGSSPTAAPTSSPTAEPTTGATPRPTTGIAEPTPQPTLGPPKPGYGPLGGDHPFLEVPDDFEVRVLATTGEPMADGSPHPIRPDGMAAFAGSDGQIILVRNHEVEALSGDGALATIAYDPVAEGGVSIVHVDPETLELTWSGVVLAGTVRNCAGGTTPTGSWLSCEESVTGPQDDMLRRHGYVFEVPAETMAPIQPVPLPHLGRFRHEAAQMTDDGVAVYLTEDRINGGFYRCVLTEPGQLRSGGRLQMLAIEGEVRADLALGRTQGDVLRATWVPIEAPDPNELSPSLSELEPQTPGLVFQQGRALGGARVNRGEGIALEGERVWFSSTEGGEAGLGQIWHYDPVDADGGTVTLAFESPGDSVLDSPDNLIVSPQGSLVICEDGSGTDVLRALTPRGELVDLARHREVDELAGVCFSPDGRVLFVNTMGSVPAGRPGRTYAITGPWERGDV